MRNIVVFLLFVLYSDNLIKAIGNYEEQVDYYTELVENGIENALNYNLPTSAEEYKPKGNLKTEDYGTYDFIIIGAGASGSALAGKLSKKTNFKILVLEAGVFPNDFVNIPGMYYYDRGTRYNWGFTSTPQTTCCLGMVDKKCPYARGKAFGGTTVLNGLIYSRGNKIDFDRWQNEGNPGWNYETVLKYFKRQENATNLTGRDPEYHGTKGPLNVQHHPIESVQTRAFINANNELNIPEVDYNGAHQHGVSRIQTNIRDGKRLTAYKAFLEPYKHRRNLHLLPESYVTKIHVRENLNLRKVHFSRRGKSYVAYAKKEIILSAGTISSPQILMLSGIGPAEHLKEMGIPVVKNLSVGNNLQDHATYYGTYFQTNYSDPDKSVREYVQEYLNGTGMYTVAGNLQGIGYFETIDNLEKGYPDAELIIVPAPILNNYTQTAFRFTDETYNGLWGSLNRETSFIIYIILLRPESKGTIRLQSNDPYDYPLIDSQFLSDSRGRDIKKIYDLIRFVHNFTNMEAFRKLNATIGPINLPACRNLNPDSRGYWYCNIRHLTMNVYHPVGTCKMGPNPLNGAVVDSRFRVHGYKTLRVVDASVLPFSFAGHPVASCMMMGERAYDFIIKDNL